MFPRLNIDLNKVYDNTKVFVDQCKKENINLMAVTKVFCADYEVAKKQVAAGVKYLADSRLKNLKRFKDLPVEKVLIRIPMLSQVKAVVHYADISLNSELEVIKALNEEAKNQDKKHKVVLMLDLGDLREGVLPTDVEETVKAITELENILLVGFGVNLTCYGGVIPSAKNLGQLAEIATKMATKYDLLLEIISGGNSSSLFLIDRGEMPEKVNNLRLGEAIVLGRETAYGEKVENTHDDVFTLEAEVVELKRKGSVPVGEIGMDAFGNTPTFEDKGEILRGILAVGHQDVNADGIMPIEEGVEILGASSDHLILNLENYSKELKIGDTLEFKLDYGSLLKLSTSEYVDRHYIK